MKVDASWVALSLVSRVGIKTIRALVDEFGSAEKVLQASPEQLKQVKGVGSKIAQDIAAIDLNQVNNAIQSWVKADVQIVTSQTNSNYPAMLLSLEDEPATLFMRGQYQPTLWGKTFAIVGTRTPMQGRIAYKLGKQLAQRGHTIVSGLAQGTDTAAHEGALDGQLGRTIAVLGSGVLNVYPTQNQKLATRIIKQGALLSENHPFADATAPRLVARNRIIAGLAQHLIVVETAIDGGAMYAARFAAQQGREVYALDIKASGNRHLLQHEGARPIAPDLQNLPFR